MLHVNKTSDYLYLGEKPKPDIKYYGKIYYDNGTSYQGYFINEKKCGYGEERTLEGYNKGYYRNDSLNGKSITYNKNKGSYIDCYYTEGILDGDCTVYDEKSNLVNKGMYKNGKSCVSTFETTWKIVGGKPVRQYEGYMFEDNYNGFGKLFVNNMVYIGNFTTGKKDGKFLICYMDGTLAYSPQTNLDVIIDIDKIKKDNFNNYKNTIDFVNDMYDGNHNIVYKENNQIKYIGKLNSDMKYNDRNGVYYMGKTIYSGKFVDGIFKEGVVSDDSFKYKGDVDNLDITGNGTINFTSGEKYAGKFKKGLCEDGILNFKVEDREGTLKCNANVKYIYDHTIIELRADSNSEILLGNDRYIGDIKISSIHTAKNVNNRVFIQKGKHYLNNILKYDGTFRNFKYNGKGIKYHSNGKIEVNGYFQLDEPVGGDYFDDNGILVFSDMENYSDNEMHELGGENEVNENMQIVNDINNILNAPFLSDAFANTNVNVINNIPAYDVNDLSPTNIMLNHGSNVQN